MTSTLAPPTDSTPAAPLPVIAEVVRSGFVEGRHHGSVLALGPDGSVRYARGEVRAPILPRSCNKPVQALGMLRLGLELPPDLLALACASHSGEPFHVAGARRILDLAGLGEERLQTPVELPMEDAVRERHLRAGGSAEPILMNCSGKHAAMLLTCTVNGWSLGDYLDPRHRLQRSLATTFAAATGEPIAHVAVDGCGAPLLSTSLTGLARAFARLAIATEGPEHRIATALRDHPEFVSGTERDEHLLQRALPGTIAKAGAESVYVVAFPDGRVAALKVEDGGARARPVVMAALLAHLGWDRGVGADPDAVRRTGRHPLLGGGEPVGEVRAVLA